MRNHLHKIVLLAIVFTLSACEKLVEIESPIDTLTSTEIFNSDAQAQSAMAGVYSKMINGDLGSGGASTEFSGGMVSIFGALSADELNVTEALPDNESFHFNANRLLFNNFLTAFIWKSAYTTIYGANAVIEGIAASTSSRLTADTRKKLTGEALFVRAFAYFYLVNLFGDVPQVLTIDFNQTRYNTRASKEDLYKLMIADLLAAQAALPPTNTNAAGDRIYPDKWAATALLARVYLFAGDPVNAYKQAGAVIANAGQFTLETDLQKTFLKGSREAIFQLKQNTAGSIGNATPEGITLIPTAVAGNPSLYSVKFYLPDYLVAAFETGDKRFTDWVGISTSNTTGSTKHYPYKYKTGLHNRVVGAEPTELYMVLRLAEQYLIRAEAAAQGAAALTNAIDDLNMIRERAGLEALPYSLSQSEVLEAIEKERRVELFLEWGHRWLDLKRTGKASAVLSQYPVKQPWEGDYQLLYPIPSDDLKSNPNLTPNPGYF
jgi:hypothetical protein